MYFKTGEAEKRISTVSLILLILGLCSLGTFLPLWLIYEAIFFWIVQILFCKLEEVYPLKN